MEQNEEFLKFWPKSRLIENWDEIQDFPIFFFYKNRKFLKILTNVEIFQNVD